MSSMGLVRARVQKQRRARVRRVLRTPSALIILVCTGLLALPSAPAEAAGRGLGPGLGPLVGAVHSLLGGLNGLLGALLGNADPSKLDGKLRKKVHDGDTGSVRVIITNAPGQDLGLIGQVVAMLGGVVRLTLTTVGAIVADVPVDNLLSLSGSPSVHSISIDAPVLSIDGNEVSSSNAPPPNAYTLRSALGLDQMTPSAAGVGVAIVDSGIDPQADFAGRITAFYDFTGGNGATVALPVDAYGHGTHVAGIIASSGAQSSNAQYRGVGASARLIGLRVLDANGAGQTSQVIQAIEFAVNNRALLGIDVMNLSLGHPVYETVDTDPLVRAVESAARAGIVVVASAGNFGYNHTTGQTGYGGITSPGNAPSVISVGALRTLNTNGRDDDSVAPYSSRGPSWYDAMAKPDLVAPGDGIISNAPSSSTLYSSYPAVRVDASHMRLNGTSMAAAVTSGVAALVIEASRGAHPLSPRLSPNAVKAILQYSATQVGFAGAPPDGLVQGAGAINVPAALALAQAIDPGQPVGSDWLSGSPAPFTTYGNIALPWAQDIIWRDTLLSGSLLELNRPAWSPSLPWGASTTWTPDVVTGNNLVWGGQINWAGNIVWGGQMVGTCTTTQTFTWGSADTCTNGQTFTWGSADDPSTTVWGNLATAPTDGQTFTWGSSDPSSLSQPQSQPQR